MAYRAKNPEMESLTPTEEALAICRERLDRALKVQGRVPWSAVASLTRQECALLVALEAGEGEEEEEVTPEQLRAEILALPDELVPVARAALAERSKHGRR